jgi:hypothetical protein
VTYVLNTIYSWPFFTGAIIGSVLWRIYCRQKALYLDIHDPLPNNAKHKVAQLNRLWVAGLALVLSLGYILLSAEKTHDQTVLLSQNVARCWAESYAQAKAQIDINAQNDGISRQQQQLQRQFDIDTSNWLKDLVVPPGDLADQSSDSPARKQYGLQRTAVYQEEIDELGKQFDNLVNQRKVLDEQRAMHPLPEPRCGK